MTIWADADSLPREVRELISRNATNPKHPRHVVFVSNRKVSIQKSPYIRAVIVGKGQSSISNIVEDTADEYIMQNAVSGDILITRDIPLASRAIKASIYTLNDRGQVWNEDTIRERLSYRNYLTQLREQGIAPELPKARTFNQKDIQAFANALDKALHYAEVQ